MKSRSAAGKRNPWLIAVVISIATFMEVLDTSIANVALSHIAGALAANADESTWVLTSYLVASAVILPISAWLSGVIGAKTLLHAVRRAVHREFLSVWDRPQPGIFDRIPGAAGPRRRRHGAERAIDAGRHLSARKARPSLRALRRRGDRCADDRTDPRRLHYRQLVVALDLLHQRADRRDLPCPRVLAGQRA